MNKDVQKKLENWELPALRHKLALKQALLAKNLTAAKNKQHRNGLNIWRVGMLSIGLAIVVLVVTVVGLNVLREAVFPAQTDLDVQQADVVEPKGGEEQVVESDPELNPFNYPVPILTTKGSYWYSLQLEVNYDKGKLDVLGATETQSPVNPYQTGNDVINYFKYSNEKGEVLAWSPDEFNNRKNDNVRTFMVDSFSMAYTERYGRGNAKDNMAEKFWPYFPKTSETAYFDKKELYTAEERATLKSVCDYPNTSCDGGRMKDIAVRTDALWESSNHGSGFGKANWFNDWVKQADAHKYVEYKGEETMFGMPVIKFDVFVEYGGTVLKIVRIYDKHDDSNYAGISITGEEIYGYHNGEEVKLVTSIKIEARTNVLLAKEGDKVIYKDDSDNVDDDDGGTDSDQDSDHGKPESYPS